MLYKLLQREHLDLRVSGASMANGMLTLLAFIDHSSWTLAKNAAKAVSPYYLETKLGFSCAAGLPMCLNVSKYRVSDSHKQLRIASG